MSKRHVIANVDYGRNLDEYVSENFQYWEFVSSELAVRKGIKIYLQKQSGNGLKR